MCIKFIICTILILLMEAPSKTVEEIIATNAPLIDAGDADDIISSGLNPESTTGSSTVKITMSSMAASTIMQTTPAITTASQFTTMVTTTSYATTNSITTTTQRSCPPSQLFTHGSFQRIYYNSRRICPEIDINIGNNRLNCFRIYQNGYMKEEPYAFYYYPQQYLFNKYGSWIFSPYMADLDLGSGSAVKYSTYSKYTYFGLASSNVPDKLYEIDQRIYEYTRSRFQSVWAVVITWENVRSRRLYGETWANYPGITFQMVLVTDGYRTYLLYLYKPCQMDMKINMRALMGYAGGGKYYIYKDSLKANSLVNIDRNGNTGKEGAWMFDISGFYPQTSKLKCLRWFANTLYIPLFNYCPCTEGQAWFDFRFLYVPPLTYISLFSGRRCEYNWFWTSPLRYGITQQYNRFFNFYQWYFEDQLPFDTCWNAGLSWLYFRKRPLDFCQGYRFPFFARTFGDPHIQTFDGYKYSFNGLGEYTFLDVHKKTNQVKMIEIQARTQLATNENGTTVNATIFSAFAMKDFQTNTSAQVEMSEDKKGLTILLNDKDLTIDFKETPNFQKLGKISVLRKSNDSQDPSVSFTFQSGIDLTVTVSTQMLGISLSIPEDVQETIITKGLQGYIDGNDTNDLMTPNGTILSVNSTEEEIFYNFGQLWLINESLFTYPAGQTKNDYIDTSFRPLFLDKTLPKYVEAVKICKGDENSACIYDFIATENKELAEKTGLEANSAEEDLKLARNHAPLINGTTELHINVSEPVVWELSVTDKDMDSVRIDIQDGSEYITMSGSGYNFNLTILIPALKVVNISVIAIDSKNKSSGGFPLKVILCSGCSGNGICEPEDVEKELEFYEQLRCTCNTGYDGSNCNQDFDGCAENPCVEKKYCTDLSPAEQVAQNREFNCRCPVGFQKQDDNRCFDIDECKAENPCDQECINTEGSFRCACNEGYDLKKDTKCINTNECAMELDDCQHQCTDTTPGYTCSCYPGYKLKTDKKTCEKENVTIPCTKNCDNANGCANNTCFCNQGFKLNGTDYCNDIDECADFPCEGTCRNTDGSYICECPFGKKLVDRTKCEVCDDTHWGKNCNTLCSCSNNAAACNPESGCECQEGWKGEFCTVDIDECQGDNECTKTEKCENKLDGYDCVCLPGYEKEGTNCVDIDECKSEKICPSMCDNSLGSFSCKCEAGFEGEDGHNCTDIDECATNIHGCEQECINNEGSFACGCGRGYKLQDDRRTCFQLTEIEACTKANCSANEYCKYENGTATCVCKNGYEVDSNTATCTLIDLCKNDPCQNGTCFSNTTVLTCDCQDGFYQKGGTCIPCNSINWGHKCLKTCDCLKGKCNNVQGCICDDGYKGLKCDEKKKYCLNDTCDETSTCKSLETNYTCECKTGYNNANPSTGKCTKCDSNHWGENCLNKCDCVNGNCNNTIGCVCDVGYLGKYCDERIDYCVNNSCNANSTCKSESGNYSCPCKDGYYRQRPENANCEICVDGRWGINCMNPCNCDQGACDNVLGCVCSPGYFGTFCNESHCTSNTCDETSTCKVLPTNYTCICKDGYSDPTPNIGNCTKDIPTTTQIYTSAPITTDSQTTTEADVTTKLGTTPEDIKTTTQIITSAPITTDSQTTAKADVTTKLQTTPALPEASFVYTTSLILNLTFPEESKIEALKADIRTALINYYKDVPGFLTVSIIDIKKGSVVVNAKILTQQKAEKEINQKTTDLKTSPLPIRNEYVAIISTKPINCIKGCTVTADKDFYLELTLGLVIPAIIILIAIIVICVWFRRRNDFAARRLNDSDVTNVQQAFGSVSSIFQSKHIPVNDDFLGTARFTAWETDEPISPSRFYINNALASQDTFRIKRPHLKP